MPAADGSAETGPLLEKLLAYEVALPLLKTRAANPTGGPVLPMHFREGDTSFRLFTMVRDPWNTAGRYVAGGQDREFLSNGGRHSGAAAKLGRLDPSAVFIALLDSSTHQYLAVYRPPEFSTISGKSSRSIAVERCKLGVECGG